MNEQQAFEEALRIQAVGAGTPTLTLDDVRGRARGIRRRRAAVASAAGAAVVAAAAAIGCRVLLRHSRCQLRRSFAISKLAKPIR